MTPKYEQFAPFDHGTYYSACVHRTFAEQYSEPEYYDLAAELFERIEMWTPANRCRERAEHYRHVAKKQMTLEGDGIPVPAE